MVKDAHLAVRDASSAILKTKHYTNIDEKDTYGN